MKKATVLMPTHDHGRLMAYAIESVQHQTVSDWELFIVGDGAPEETRELVNNLSRHDERIRYFDHPKGPRHGEIYRHQALRQAQGEIVCYLSDDDLWLPTHIECMRQLLKEHDFAHTLPLRIGTDQRPAIYSGSLGVPESRASLLRGANFIPLSAGAHTLAFYSRLPFGWRTTPEGVWTDLYMWQQILSNGARFCSGYEVTLLHFPSSERNEMSRADRLAELALWSNRLTAPEFAPCLSAQVLQFLSDRQTVLELEIAEARATAETAGNAAAIANVERQKLSQERESVCRQADVLREKLASQTAEIVRLREILSSVEQSFTIRLKKAAEQVPGIRPLFQAAKRVSARGAR